MLVCLSYCCRYRRLQEELCHTDIPEATSRAHLQHLPTLLSRRPTKLRLYTADPASAQKLAGWNPAAVVQGQ